MKFVGVLLLAASTLFAGARNERYALILADAPLAADISSPKDLVRAARRAPLEAKQGTVAAAVAQHGWRVTATEQLLVNVVFVEAPAGSEQELGAMPGVRRVQRLPKLKRDLDAAVNLMNVPAAWAVVNGPQNAGAGVKIAVLDTGIDIGHPAMQDASLQYPSGFPKCRQDNGDCNFVNTKVVAARSYVNLIVGTDPASSRPDDLSPRDRVGHGTAVATIAAGVRSSGPAATIQGVAPRAWLGNYKIYGSPGVNGQYTTGDALIAALRDALNDGMDIAVVPQGAPAEWGPGDVGGGNACEQPASAPCDVMAAAVENAVRMGLTVVVSAGNDGDIANVYPAFNSIHTPGTAPSAITVGASTNSHIYFQSIRIEGANVPSDLQLINTYFSDGPKPNPASKARVRDVATTGDDGTACSPLPANSLNGSFALIARGGGCDFPAKIYNAQNAGAVGAIIYQSGAGTEGVFQIRNVQNTAIPAALIGNKAGVALKAYIARQPDAVASLDPSVRSISTTEFDTMAMFSSRGPSIRSSGVKPELVAVGTDLYTGTQTYDPSGDLYDPSGFTAVQGTSFAAPMVAGTVAMVKQRNPRFTPAQLKSAVVNTANVQVSDFDAGRIIPAEILDRGAGKLDAGSAVQTTVTVEPSTVSFGVLSGSLPSNSTQLQVCNFGGSSVTLSFAVQPFSSRSGSASVAVGSQTVNVGAGACANNTVRLTGSTPGAGAYEGQIVVTGGSVPLRIPYQFFVADGVPWSIFPILNGTFEAVPNVTKFLEFKVVDRFGVPVANAPVQFQTTRGNGTVTNQSTTTDELGIGYATVRTGDQTGTQEFFAFVGNTQNFGNYFRGQVRPTITIGAGGVVDAASQQGGKGFAPGSYISIYGTGLSDAFRSYSTLYLPLSIAGVSVSFELPSGASYPGRLQFVSPGQINVLIPWELAGADSARMKVSIGDYSSELVTIPIAAASPAMFEYTESGGRLLAAVIGQSGLISSTNTAKRGSVISLYVNGLGAVDNQPASGDPASATTLSRVRNVPNVTIGGRPADVQFAGLAPGYVGLYQINVQVAGDTPTGLQQVVITAGGVSSKPSNLPVE